MEKIRGFEVAKGFENEQINMPIRKTGKSAGYDVEVLEDTVIPPFAFREKTNISKNRIKSIYAWRWIFNVM